MAGERTYAARSDGPPLTWESLKAIMESLPKPPVFLVAHWLKGSVYLKCEREGREEIRFSPAAWAKFCRLSGPAAEPDPFATPVTNE